MCQGIQQSALIAVDCEPDLSPARNKGVRIDTREMVCETMGEEHGGLTSARLAQCDELRGENVAISINEAQNKRIVVLQVDRSDNCED